MVKSVFLLLESNCKSVILQLLWGLSFRFKSRSRFFPSQTKLLARRNARKVTHCLRFPDLTTQLFTEKGSSELQVSLVPLCVVLYYTITRYPTYNSFFTCFPHCNYHNFPDSSRRYTTYCYSKSLKVLFLVLLAALVYVVRVWSHFQKSFKSFSKRFLSAKFRKQVKDKGILLPLVSCTN